jgi:hypothetical protein
MCQLLCSVIIPNKQNITAAHKSGTTYNTGLHSFKTAQEWNIFQMHSLKFGSSNWLSCECKVAKLIARHALQHCTDYYFEFSFMFTITKTTSGINKVHNPFIIPCIISLTITCFSQNLEKKVFHTYIK